MRWFGRPREVPPLLRRLEAGDTVILDVRPEPEYAGGHLPGAMRAADGVLEWRVAGIPVQPGAA